MGGAAVAVTGAVAAKLVAPVTSELRASGSSGYTVFRICPSGRSGNVGGAFLYPSRPWLVVSGTGARPHPRQGASMKAPNPFWHLAVLLIFAFELNPSACSFFTAERAGGAGGNGGSVTDAGRSGGNPGSAGSNTGNAGSSGNPGGPDGGGYDGPNLGVDAGGKITIGHTQCSDGIDNDGDGLIDYADPECVGPNDNDESSFAT